MITPETAGLAVHHSVLTLYVSKEASLEDILRAWTALSQILLTTSKDVISCNPQTPLSNSNSPSTLL